MYIQHNIMYIVCAKMTWLNDIKLEILLYIYKYNISTHALAVNTLFSTIFQLLCARKTNIYVGALGMHVFHFHENLRSRVSSSQPACIKYFACRLFHEWTGGTCKSYTISTPNHPATLDIYFGWCSSCNNCYHLHFDKKIIKLG